jgi:hypothetical protein
MTRASHHLETVQAGTPMTVAGNDRVARPAWDGPFSFIGLKISLG